MKTIEELDAQIAELNGKLKELYKRQEIISAELHDCASMRWRLLSEKAKDLSPIKGGNLYRVGNTICEPSFIEMTYDNEVHIAFAQLTKKGYRNQRTYPKHLYIKIDGIENVKLEDLRTCDNEAISLA